MLNRHARALTTRAFTPLARFLLARGVTADAVTIVGTLGVVLSALVFFPAAPGRGARSWTPCSTGCRTPRCSWA